MTISVERASTILEQLNAPQREAVQVLDQPVLVVAGAGSGKTRVITYRIAYLLINGVACSENILALTFTNKAAGEMKARVAGLTGSEFRSPLISTFHAFGSQFLRKNIPLLGYRRDFFIYDEEDQLALVKECCRELNLSENRYEPRELQTSIKWFKSRNEAVEIYDPNVSNLFQLYLRKLKALNAVDFDDLLIHPLRILRENSGVLKHYQEKYRFLLVDEYQDTNEIQYELLKTLATGCSNILVVGDEDQSIYKFRGARSENMRYFLRDFPQARIIKLEQNYRSTKTILKAAQAVITRNSARIKKELWTENAAGEPVEIYHAFDEYDEATLVTLRVMSLLKDFRADEIGVLYRSNAQSRVLEESLVKAQIPHRIIGAVGFYERREIKDCIAFLRLLVTREDAVSFLRIINVPPRGIGKKTLQQIQIAAEKQQIGLFEAARRIGGRNLSAFLDFYDNSAVSQPSSFLEQLLSEIGYQEYLRKEDSMTVQDRMENISEFLSVLRENESLPQFDLASFLSELPLNSGVEEAAQAVTLLTAHSAKGLEFRVIFVVGLEEGLFPHIRSMEVTEDLEEERRLFYVAMTRAKEKLFLSWAQRRGMFGIHGTARPSSFLQEIPSWFRVNRLSEKFGMVPQGNPQNVASSDEEFRIGSIVRHEKFGRGTVLNVEGVAHDWKLTIRFSDGIKKIFTRYAQITKEI